MAQKILVAEDDAAINEVVCEYLKESGFEPVPVYDGNTAAEAIAGTEGISLFILDIMLPGLTGLDLLRLTRASKTYGKAPVIMLTALTDERTQLTSFNGQTDDYVTKPFSPKILVKRVEALLKRCGKAESEDSVLTIGDVQINLNSFEVYENSRKLELTLKEFELLKALALNGQKALSRQQLLDLAWGYDFFGDERAVDTHIKNLRKKLTGDIIQTIKGVGYKIGKI